MRGYCGLAQRRLTQPSAKRDRMTDMKNADLLKTASHAPSIGPRMTVRRSPTLSLAEEIDRARREGQSVFSLSTPTFPEIMEANALEFPFSNKLTPAEGLYPLRKAAREEFFGRWVLPRGHARPSAGAIDRTDRWAGMAQL